MRQNCGWVQSGDLISKEEIEEEDDEDSRQHGTTPGEEPRTKLHRSVPKSLLATWGCEPFFEHPLAIAIVIVRPLVSMV